MKCHDVMYESLDVKAKVGEPLNPGGVFIVMKYRIPRLLNYFIFFIKNYNL